MYLELLNEHLHFSSISGDETSGYVNTLQETLFCWCENNSWRCSNASEIMKSQKPNQPSEPVTHTELLALVLVSHFTFGYAFDHSRLLMLVFYIQK